MAQKHPAAVSVESDSLWSAAFEKMAAAAIAGETAEINRLFQWVRPAMVRYCRARIGGAPAANGDADDVAQEVCLGLMAALPNYTDSVSRFVPFLYGIARHKVADYFRKHGRDRADLGRMVPEVADSSPGPEAVAVLRDTAAWIGALTGCLSDRQRHVIALRVVAGLSSEEAAQVLGTTSSTVRVTQWRALARLRVAAAIDVDDVAIPATLAGRDPTVPGLLPEPPIPGGGAGLAA